MTRSRSAGFTIIELALIVVGVAILGVVGWRFYAVTHQSPASSQAAVNTNASAISSTSDLKQTDSDLQSLSVDDGTLSSLSSQTAY